MEKESKQKVFIHKLSNINYILFAVLCAVMLPFGLYNSCKAAGVGKLTSYYPALEISSSIVCFLAVIFILSVILFDRYIITEKSLIRQKIFKKVIPSEALITIRKDEQNALTVLYYADAQAVDTDGISFLILYVGKRKEEQFIDCIRQLNPHVSVERISINGKAE